MHLTRPKSSKGRSRPSVNDSSYPGHVDAPQSVQSVSPDCPASSRPDGSPRCQSQPTMRQASQLSQDGVLQHAPDAPPQSLNKYTVLPSIGALGPRLSYATVVQQRRDEPALPAVEKDVTSGSGVVRGAGPEPRDRAPTMARGRGSLLLAVRAPCGRRFEQHFEPTDTLLAVRASAELRSHRTA
ncbi:UBX domain-containing protein 10 isoform 2-T2 [Spinachia spinachia]